MMPDRMGQDDADLLRLRRIAKAGVGAPLRGDFEGQRQRAGGGAFDRDANGDALVIHLDAAEDVVVLLLAGREQRGPGRDGLVRGSEAELVAVEVILRGNRVDDFDGVAVERAGARLERDRRVEEVVAGSGRGDERAEQDEETHDHWSVSAATQFR
jgi:hypothetical protein